MPCESIFNKGKAVGFMCSRGRRKPKPPPCCQCGNPSTKLCDYRDMKPIYDKDKHGNILRKRWIPNLNTCSRSLCDACAHHFAPDTDYCDLHSSRVARARSAKAERLHQERLRQMGLEDEK